MPNNQFRFYVYAIRYAYNITYGKGAGKRAYQQHKNNITPDDISRIVILETNLSELDSFALERRYIRWYGRKDTNTDSYVI